MVTVYGLNDKIGNLTYYDSSGQNEYNFAKPYSEKTAELIDKEISNIIEEQYQRAIQLLTEHKDKLTELAEILLDKEVIFKDDLQRIFGNRPHHKEEEKLTDQTPKQVEEKAQPTEEKTSEDSKNPTNNY